MKKEEIISRYHQRLSRELGCIPRFKIGDTIRVRKNVGNISHGHERDWVIWDDTRKNIEGMEGKIIDIDYIDDVNSKNKDGCIGYTIKIIGKGSTINVHQECLKRINEKRK